MNERIVLVNETDRSIGEMDKLEVHQKGLLHRAFSIFLFDDQGKLLLQKRAAGKYHSANLWSNTCCSHPRPEEDTLQAAVRRLKEEMGIETALEKKFDLIYRVQLDNNLMEYEYDHIYTGRSNQTPLLNREEVSDYRWVTIQELRAEIKSDPVNFTEWLKILLLKDAFNNII